MSALTELPSEILYEICSLAQIKRSGQADSKILMLNSTLLNVCQTCHKLSNIAQDILYQSIAMKGKHRGSTQQLWYLARTILTRPDLGRKVKRLSLPIRPHESTEVAIGEVKMFLDPQNLFSTPYPSPVQQVWAYELCHALLSHLPNLETFHTISIGLDLRIFKDHIPSQFFGQLRVHHFQAVPGIDQEGRLYKHLRSLEIEQDEIIELPIRPALKELGSIFSLSTVESLTIRKRQIMHFPGVHTLRPPMTSSLSTLQLFECSVDLASMNHFCNVIQGLRHFAFVTLDPLVIYRGTLHGQPRLDRSPHVRQPTPMQVLDALSYHSSTLESLKLDFCEWFHPGCEALWEYDGTDPMQRYASFRRFHKLTSLDIEYERMCVPTELPESLIALVLTHRPNQPCLSEQPLHYPRLEKRYTKLVHDGICPWLRFVKVGRFLPFRYVDGRALDWRKVHPSQWDAFTSDSIPFTDSSYDWNLDDNQTDVEMDQWHDPWWRQEFTVWWPLNLRTDIVEFLRQETARWVAAAQLRVSSD